MRDSREEALLQAWLLYRRGRVFAASAVGRNPRIPFRAMLPLKQEIRAIRALIRARAKPVRVVETHPDRNLWDISMGTLRAPRGADVGYMHNVTLEMLAGVYPLDSVAPGGLVIETAITTNPGAHHICEDGDGDTAIDVTTIDDIAPKLKLSRIDYIKMDIEGAEAEALRGTATTIRTFRPQLTIVTEHTEDLIANTRAVVEVIRPIDPSYRYMVTEAQFTRDAGGVLKLIPYTLHFCHAVGTAGAQ